MWLLAPPEVHNLLLHAFGGLLLGVCVPTRHLAAV
jgi:hypothetical protein